jgi:hypothetical protein
MVPRELNNWSATRDIENEWNYRFIDRPPSVVPISLSRMEVGRSRWNEWLLGSNINPFP